MLQELKKRVDLLFTGITEKEIQQYINSSRVNQKLKCRFENKAPLRPIKSKTVWNRIQINLMSMEDKLVEIDGKSYSWILSCVDVFSRYPVVRALYTKNAVQIAEVLQFFSDFGPPAVIQCDNGTEFKGYVEKVAGVLEIKIIRGSVRHQQSQGKVRHSGINVESA